MSHKEKTLMGIYSSSWGISMTTMMVVSVLEIFMIFYSFTNTAIYGPYLMRYRLFYISLLAMSVIYMALNVWARRDFPRRYTALCVANPVCAAFFFAWSLGITWSDSGIYHAVDPTVFMTFSLTVPLSFYLYPGAYAAIAGLADVLLLYLTVKVSNSVAPVINISVFLIFQFVLGLSFLRLKKGLAERIAIEHENADIDVMTGFANRRVYEADMNARASAPAQANLAYIAIDINGLKAVNDSQGHDVGDKLIVGASRCIEAAFRGVGKPYRIGGDEFVILAEATPDQLNRLFEDYEARTLAWSRENNLALTTSFGYACRAEQPDMDLKALARAADDQMYQAKTRYYQTRGIDRRRAPEAGSTEAVNG